MTDKDNYLQTAELSTEQNTNMIDGILGNNAPLIPPVPVPEIKPLDKVKEPPPRKAALRSPLAVAVLWSRMDRRAVSI